MRRLMSFAVLALSLASFAQTESSPRKVRPPQRAPAAQNVEFTDDVLEVCRQTPLGEIYAVPRRPDFKSLIQVRQNFNDKLRDSVHEM